MNRVGSWAKEGYSQKVSREKKHDKIKLEKCHIFLENESILKLRSYIYLESELFKVIFY